MKILFLNTKPSTLSVALSLVLITGCMPNKPEPELWLKDKELVVQSLQDAHVNNAKLQADIDAMDQRLLSLENLNAKQTAKISAMEETIAVQNVASTKPVLKKSKAKKKSKTLNKRLDALSAKLNPSVVKPVDTAATALAGKNAYTAAYLALKSGRYDESSTGFGAVVKEYAKGEYTDQAYYWLGESLVAQHRNQEAVEAFKTVATQYKDSPKHAAALLKLASVYQAMGKTGDSRAALARVIQEHPDSRSAERARIQLSNMSQSSGAKK
jgi:tol-pal system protein YbgF